MKKSKAIFLGCLLFATGISQVSAKEWRVGHGTGYSLSDIEFTLKSQIKPGDVVLIAAGTYDLELGESSLVLQGFNGSADKPIVFKGEFESATPILKEGVNINNSHHIALHNLNIIRNTRRDVAAVVVQGGSSYVRLAHLNVHDSHIGVSFSDPAKGNSIRYSHLFRNDYYGIASNISSGAKANNKPSGESDASVIEYNQVEENGSHGIDLESSYWRVRNNRVVNNGHAYGGTSGIHLFTAKDRSRDDPGCGRNEIIYNYVSGQKDSKLFDGNGIQIDHYCDDNLVAHNVVKNNDGAGIALFIGRNNTIVSNTVYHNAVDKSRITRGGGAERGEIILSSQAYECIHTDGKCTQEELIPVAANRSSDNKIYDNIAVSAQADVPAIYVTEDFKNPARNTNHLYVNWYRNDAEGAPLRWGYESTWDIDGKTVSGNVLAPVTFKDTTLDDAAGFQLLKFAPNDNFGWAPEQRRPDMGQRFPLVDGQGKTSYWGAYYLCSIDACASN